MEITINSDGTVTAVVDGVTCPSCNASIEASVGLHDPTIVPKEGDISLCGHCGELLLYNADLKLEQAPMSILRELDPETCGDILVAQSIIRSRASFLDML